MITYILYCILYYVSRLFAFSYLVGSQHAFFSGACVVDLLTGLLGGIPFIMCTYLSKVAFAGLSPVMFITRLPGLSGALYWKVDRALFRCGVPLLCMALFLVH